MAALKIFKGNFDGKNYRLVATTSKAKAMVLLGQPNKRRFDRDFALSKVTDDCAIAVESPDVVFTKPISYTPNEEFYWKSI